MTPYERVLPHDTQNLIEEFLLERFIGTATQLAAADVIEAEIERIVANPMLGASVPDGPFEKRRIYRFKIAVGDQRLLAEFAYSINKERAVVVFSGFQEVRAPL